MCLSTALNKYDIGRPSNTADEYQRRTFFCVLITVCYYWQAFHARRPRSGFFTYQSCMPNELSKPEEALVQVYLQRRIDGSQGVARTFRGITNSCDTNAS